MVGSTYPGGGEAAKGLAVRQLKSYASWVQTVQKLKERSREEILNNNSAIRLLNSLNHFELFVYKLE